MNVHTAASGARSRILGDGGKGFPTAAAMLADATAQRARCSEFRRESRGVLFTTEAGRLGLDLGGGEGAQGFTPWALRQVGGIARVPAPVLERLRPETAARVLNETWPRDGAEGLESRAFLVEGARMEPGAGPAMEPTLRAVVSPSYRRVWDADLLGEASRWLLPSGWTPAYPERNTSGTPEGERERALWRSDRDSFAFFMSERRAEGGDDGLGGMRRGLFIGNSEVGARSLVWGSFWFREVCANFLIWDARDAQVRRRRHTAGIVGEVADLRRWMREQVPTTTDADLVPFHVLNRTPFQVAEGDEPWAERFAVAVASQFDVTQALARKAADLAGSDSAARRGTWWDAVNAVTAAARSLNPGDRFEASMVAGRMASKGLALATS